jgi:hypothetical protein
MAPAKRAAPAAKADEPVSDNPHAFEEDPEDCIGDEIADPWSDPDQLDWPNEDVEVND